MPWRLLGRTLAGVLDGSVVWPSGLYEGSLGFWAAVFVLLWSRTLQPCMFMADHGQLCRSQRWQYPHDSGVQFKATALTTVAQTVPSVHANG